MFGFLFIFQNNANIFNKYVLNKYGEPVSARHYSQLWNTVASILGVYVLWWGSLQKGYFMNSVSSFS